ncbi:MAG: uroporphyrinogen decarboxylase [Acidimicrobiia bacterium]|nr:MAG: uroporphyrinogen decarboxylase [Acidimicrobiia bacterium]
MKPLIAALRRQPLERPPIWVMRQAGRYLPEYRRIREQHPFREAVSDPDVATEITLLPLRRFDLDAAIVFADIMTPLEAMGVEVEYSPGPRLRPMSPGKVAELPDPDPAGIEPVIETIRRVGAQVAPEVAVIGFAGAPTTLLAYLLEGSGSKDFPRLRRALVSQPRATSAALVRLAEAMRSYLSAQIGAGADAVQLFDSWAGVLSRAQFADLAGPSAAATLERLEAPTIYFAPASGHFLDLLPMVGADCYGLDWRIPIDRAWKTLGEVAVQGNLDPAVLLTDPDTIRRTAARVLEEAGGRPGHVFNLGHGIHRDTPPEHLQVLVETVKG